MNVKTAIVPGAPWPDVKAMDKAAEKPKVRKPRVRKPKPKSPALQVRPRIKRQVTFKPYVIENGVFRHHLSAEPTKGTV